MENKQELPTGWKWVKLGELIKSTQSGTWGEEPLGMPEEEIYNVIRSTEINHQGIIIINDEKVAKRKVKPETAKKYFLQLNDLLIVRSGGTTGKIILGRVGIYLGKANKYLFSNFLLKAQVNETLVLPEFLWRYLNWGKFLQDNIPNLMRRTTGIQNLPMDEYFSIEIPLPPLSEQKRIAAKLQEMMQEIDQARNACEKQLEAAKALSSSYLREVFESLEAQNWPKKKLGEVCKYDSGLWGEESDDSPFCYPILRSNNIRDGKMIFEDLAIRKIESKHVEDKSLQYGDILITTSSGSRDLLGKSAIFIPFDDKVYLFSNFTMRLRPLQKLIDNFYCYFYLQSPDAKKVLQLLQDTTTGLRNLNRKKFLNQLIPLPPLSEQKQISEYLKEKIDYAEKLKSSIEKELETINSLPQSILSKAFRGEL